MAGGAELENLRLQAGRFQPGCLGSTNQGGVTRTGSIMAKRKKRSKVQKGKGATARGKARKASKSTRGKASKRTVARAKSKRARVKNGTRKKVQRKKQPGAPTVVVDVIEKPAPGVITITEFEETEVREGIPGRGEPEEC